MDDFREKMALTIFGPGGLSGGTNCIHLDVADAAIALASKETILKLAADATKLDFNEAMIIIAFLSKQGVAVIEDETVLAWFKANAEKFYAMNIW